MFQNFRSDDKIELLCGKWDRGNTCSNAFSLTSGTSCNSITANIKSASSALTDGGPANTCGTPINAANTYDVWFKFQATTSEIDIKILSGESKGTLFGPRLTLFNSTGEVISMFKTPGHNTAYANNISLTPGAVYYFSVDLLLFVQLS